LGLNAGTNVSTASNVICIGAIGADENNSCFVGNIFDQTSSGGTAVFVSSQGKLGTATSSRRFKNDVKPMENASEALFSLKPVTFHYKSDNTSTPQFGLIAEEVAQVNPDLVVRDKNGEIYTVRYDAVNAMLLNEFLKEHKKVEQLDATVASLMATVKEQASRIEKVSAQLQMSKPAPRIVNNNQ
jgi:trimeric autotransporter adhesin